MEGCANRGAVPGQLSRREKPCLILPEVTLASRWTVLCDFDGTIAQDDVTDSLLLRFGRPGWDALEADWRAGRIGSRDCMAGQVALLDCSIDELCDHLSTVVIDSYFPAFVAAVQSRGWPLTVVSDGLDFVITEVLRRHGLAALPVVANHLVADGARRWRLEFPHARPRCVSRSGNCKCAQVPVSPDALRRKVLMIGDGVSDFCVAERCDLSFARKQLLEHCLDNGLRHNAVTDFRQAFALLPTLDSFQLTSGHDFHDEPD